MSAPAGAPGAGVALRELDPDELAGERSGEWAGVLADLASLEAELFGDDAWDADALRDLAGTPGRRTGVAVLDGRVVGYALTGLVGDFSELLRIGTAGTVQRTGVASALLEAAVRASAADGVDRMLLEVSERNEPARAFYARHGFAEIDRRRRYYRDGADALVLQRTWGPAPERPSDEELDRPRRMDP